MSEYRIILRIEPFILENLQAMGKKIVIRKSNYRVEGNVAWLSFKPMSSNEIRWTDEYGLYASESRIIQGSTIDIMSALPDRSSQSRYPNRGEIYRLNDNGGFERVPGSDPSGDYGIVNGCSGPRSLTCGLLQSAQVNGRTEGLKPIVALPSLTNTIDHVPPLEDIEIFVESGIDAGSVITNAFRNSLKVSYSGGASNVTCDYDARRGAFVRS